MTNLKTAKCFDSALALGFAAVVVFASPVLAHHPNQGASQPRETSGSKTAGSSQPLSGQGAAGADLQPTTGSSFFNPQIGVAANTNAATVSQMTSFFGLKQLFYQFAPHAGKEDLLPAFTQELGTDPAATYQAQQLGGMVPSGNEPPSLNTQASTTQAQQYQQGQAVPHPFMQRALTIDSGNPLQTHWEAPRPGDIPFMFVPPFNPNPSGMNSQSFSDLPFMNGGLPSDLVRHTSKLSVAQKTAEKILDPNLQSAQAAYQGTAQQTADSAGQDVAGAFQGNLGQTTATLINVANEAVASPAQSGQARTMPQAIWIVQQMYQRFFLPLSLLMLLVGATMTQSAVYFKSTLANSTQAAADPAHPFEGLIRAVMALFLICAIPLTVSYSIDFGNAITAPVEQMVDRTILTSWTQGFTNPTQNMTAKQASDYYQNESTAAATGRAVFNSVQALLNAGVMVQTVYQVVMVCYLFLLGPIAAAFYAWPTMGTQFRRVLGNWFNGLANLVLWRFWWCIILLVMATRIRWLQDIGGYNPNSPWEPIVYTAFMVMLAYVPFAALDFRPGDMVQALMDKASPKSS